MYICVYSDMPGIAKIRVSVRQSALDLFSKRGVDGRHRRRGERRGADKKEEEDSSAELGGQ